MSRDILYVLLGGGVGTMAAVSLQGHGKQDCSLINCRIGYNAQRWLSRRQRTAIHSLRILFPTVAI